MPSSSHNGQAYREGDAFAVPLAHGGYAVGVIARADGKGFALGYFYGKKWQDLSDPDIFSEITSAKPIHVKVFSDNGITSGSWPNLGQLPNWHRENFPVPIFGHQLGVGDTYVAEEWDETSFSTVPKRRWRCSKEQYEQMPRAGISGWRAIEKVLSALIDG